MKRLAFGVVSFASTVGIILMVFVMLNAKQCGMVFALDTVALLIGFVAVFCLIAGVSVAIMTVTWRCYEAARRGALLQLALAVGTVAAFAICSHVFAHPQPGAICRLPDF